MQEQARPPAKPARHSLEAKPIADGQGEAARGISGRRRSILLRGLNNAVPVLLRLAFGEEFIF